MQIYFSVQDFGKIKEAKVNISNYTVFVGNNNSGKTYLMQLIYGILVRLTQFNTIDTYTKKIVDELKKNTVLRINNEIVEMIQNCINNYLEKNKEKIIYEIFQKEIQINKLYIELTLDEDDNFEFQYLESDRIKEITNVFTSFKTKKNDTINVEKLMTNLFSLNKPFSVMVAGSFNNKNKSTVDSITVSMRDENEDVFSSSIIQHILNLNEKENYLFIPASRTGLLLLYREFFAKKTDELITVFSNNEQNQNKNKYGLTMPVYDFLRFLQTAKVNEKKVQQNSKLISFIEENIIEGHLSLNSDNKIEYTPQNCTNIIPLYLTSSMINELTPLILQLSDDRNPQYLIIDEIETSLHPSKQVEMARLLSRLNNSGTKLIVSTHSDTMATKINNLLLLSLSKLSKEKKSEILKKTRMTQSDLLKNQNIHIYQFENINSGKSIVKEVYFNQHTGYQFDMFNDSVLNLYNESKTILEI